MISFGLGEQDRMLHLVRLPPAVEQGRDAAGLEDRHVADDPRRAVAHRDADAVALADPARDQAVREPVRDAVEIGEGQPLVARDDRFVGRVQRAEGAEECRQGSAASSSTIARPRSSRPMTSRPPGPVTRASSSSNRRSSSLGISVSRSFAFARTRLMRR